ncbi:unnamed protein product [Malus baccata var. baccata]
MSKRHNRDNMSLSSNLEALDIVVLVCRYLPKDLAASFTEENGTLGHINVIKQFLCLSLLHICAFTVMAISQHDYSIFTSLLSKLNQELCNRVGVHLDVVFFPNCITNDQIFQQPGWCHTLTDPCDNISYQRVVFNKRNKFNQRNYTIWLMERPCILLSFKIWQLLVLSMIQSVKGRTCMYRYLFRKVRMITDSQEEEVFAILNHKHRNDPLKIKEIISMVANSLTSLLNLEIEFKIFFARGWNNYCFNLIFLGLWNAFQ